MAVKQGAARGTIRKRILKDEQDSQVLEKAGRCKRHDPQEDTESAHQRAGGTLRGGQAARGTIRKRILKVRYATGAHL